MNPILTEENQYSKFAFKNFEKIHVLVFYSEKISQTQNYVDLVQKLEIAIQPDPIFSFAYIDINQYPSSVEQFKIKNLPVVIIKSNPEVLQEQNLIVSPTSLFLEIQKFKQPFQQAFEIEKSKYMDLCKKLIESSPFIVFIKGTPEKPKCKFTRALLAELKTLNLKFNFYDMDNDQAMRQWLKYYSGWKTFPQIFSQGKLIGGLDIIQDLIKKGDFLKKIPQECILEELSELQELQKISKIMILHQDQPDPNHQIAQYLNQKNIQYQFYNVSLNVDLQKQMQARGLIDKVYLLYNNQLYDNQQVQAIQF